MHERRGPGSVVAGKFRIEAELGDGAGGVVYRAVQEPLSRTVALKILASPEREARAIARLKHENVVTVFDVGDAGDGAQYLAMELVDGCTLRALMDRRELTVSEAREVALGIARALAHAHAAGVVHRDLKPENVMLEGERAEARAVRVVDFGLAHVSSVDGANASVTSTIAGTPAYMAPERAEPKSPHVEPASDVYSLGVVLYEMLTSTNPFRAETTLKTLLRHVEGPLPQPPSRLRADAAPFDALALSLLAKDPAARPPIAVVIEALSTAPSAAPSPPSPSTTTPAAPPTAAPPRATAPSAPPRVASRVPLAIVVVAAAFMGAVALALATSHSREVAPPVASVDAGEARAAVVVDAGEAREVAPDIATVDAGTAPVKKAATTRPPEVRAEKAGDAGVVGVVENEKPASALERRARALRESCKQPCASEVAGNLKKAVDGGLESLKQWKADFETCRVLCERR